jgi:hypothetical protein
LFSRFLSCFVYFFQSSIQLHFVVSLSCIELAVFLYYCVRVWLFLLITIAIHIVGAASIGFWNAVVYALTPKVRKFVTQDLQACW